MKDIIRRATLVGRLEKNNKRTVARLVNTAHVREYVPCKYNKTKDNLQVTKDFRLSARFVLTTPASVLIWGCYTVASLKLRPSKT